MNTKHIYNQPSIKIIDTAPLVLMDPSVNIDGSQSGEIGWSDDDTNDDARSKSRFGSLWD